MSDSSKSEPFGSDSGSEYLPGKGQKSYYKMDSESENDSSDTHENDDGSSGTKKKKQPHSQMLESGKRQVKDFFHVGGEQKQKNNDDKIAKCIPCFEKFGKSVYLKMKNAGTSGLKRHLKAKHKVLFDKEFSQEGSSSSTEIRCLSQNSQAPCTSWNSARSDGSGSGILAWVNESQRRQTVS